MACNDLAGRPTKTIGANNTRQQSADWIGAGPAEPVGPEMPDTDLAVDDLDRHQLVPRDSLGQADLVEGLGKFRLT